MSLCHKNVNGQIKKRTRVVGLFPSEESLLRLVPGVLIEISETWETGIAYLPILTKNKPCYTKPTTFRETISHFYRKNLRAHDFFATLVVEIYRPVVHR